MKLLPPSEVLYGTLDLLILKALSFGPMHGWGISTHLEQVSGGMFRLGQGSLYPALHRFESRDWVVSLWRTTENNRVGRYYELTPAGRRAFSEEMERWQSYTKALAAVLAS